MIHQSHSHSKDLKLQGSLFAKQLIVSLNKGY